MSNLGKFALVAGGLFALKLWNDSAKLATAIKEKQAGVKSTNFVGGQALPTPTSMAGGTVTTNDVPVSNSNDGVDYGRNYLNIAEGDA